MKDKNKKILFALALVMIMSVANNVTAASLSFDAKTKNYRLGETFSSSFYLASLDRSVNAMEATIVYPTKLLELIDVSTAGTESRFWIEQPKRDNSGEVKVRWLILNPGYIGKGAKILTLSFRAKAAGQAAVAVKDAQVLANDGKGTAVKTSVSGVLFNVSGQKAQLEEKLKVKSKKSKDSVKVVTETKKEAVVMPSSFVVNSVTHPLQNVWYHGDQARLTWSWPKEVLAVSYSLDNLTDTVPMSDKANAKREMVYKDLADGVFYFHIRLKTAAGWTGATHYRLNVDHSSPSLVVSVLQEDKSQLPIVKYAASDQASGVSYYEISFDNGPVKRFEKSGSLMIGGSISKGRHVVRIVAYDRAGNQSGDSKIFEYEPK